MFKTDGYEENPTAQNAIFGQFIRITIVSIKVDTHKKIKRRSTENVTTFPNKFLKFMEEAQTMKSNHCSTKKK